MVRVGDVTLVALGVDLSGERPAKENLLDPKADTLDVEAVVDVVVGGVVVVAAADVVLASLPVCAKEKVGFSGDNLRSPLASGAMLKEKPFDADDDEKAGAADVTELAAEVLPRLPNVGKAEVEAPPNVVVGFDPSDRLKPNPVLAPNAGCAVLVLAAVELVAPPAGWKLNEKPGVVEVSLAFCEGAPNENFPATTTTIHHQDASLSQE